jgi:predicted dehydrogenase
MLPLNRRDFLKDSAALTAALAGADLAVADEVKAKEGKKDDLLRVAVIGVHGRGMSHVSGFSGRNNCTVTTICDADEAVIGRAMKAVETKEGKAPRFVQDIRKVVEDKNIDVVSIATPNHWHALAAIWALQNGKDVYVEKPVSHNVSEGRRIVETARKYNRICQAGTQSRSSTGLKEAMAFLQAGKLGKITVARGLCYKRRGSIGKVDGPQDPPKTCDYDLWCGPAPQAPLMRKRLHYDWHWVWDTGNGDIGNQGIHEMDKARWGLGKGEIPRGVISLGGRFGYVDDGQTANTQVAVFDYGDCELIFEVRGLSTKGYVGATVGNVWHGTEGYMVCTNYNSATAYTPKGEVIQRFRGGEDHFANFLKAVRSRKVADLNADILDGHVSSALCHLANVSYRLGSEQAFGKKDVFNGDKDGNATFERMQTHLEENKLVLKGLNFRMGKKLALDPKTETFIGNKEADLMLTREYRKGFEVPAKV